MSDPASWPTPKLTIDVVAVTLVEGELKVLLVRRLDEPAKGELALIGGFVRVQEDADLDASVARILREKAGLARVFIEQLYSFGSANRDPRGWTATISYLAIVPYQAIEEAGIGNLELAAVDEVSGLPFEQDEILAKALERLRGKGAYSVLPAMFLPEEFTAMQLKQTYEAVLGVTFDQSGFRRKILELQIVEELPGHFSRDTKRPSQLLRVRPGATTFKRSI